MKTYKNLNNDQRGITHHLMLIGLAVVVAGAVGFAGFRVYKSKNDINAKAAGWSRIPLRNGNENLAYVYACKRQLPGGLFQVSVYANVIGSKAQSVNLFFGGKAWSTSTAAPNTRTSTATGTGPAGGFRVDLNPGSGWAAGSSYTSWIVTCS